MIPIGKLGKEIEIEKQVFCCCCFVSTICNIVKSKIKRHKEKINRGAIHMHRGLLVLLTGVRVQPVQQVLKYFGPVSSAQQQQFLWKSSSAPSTPRTVNTITLLRRSPSVNTVCFPPFDKKGKSVSTQLSSLVCASKRLRYSPTCSNLHLIEFSLVSHFGCEVELEWKVSAVGPAICGMIDEPQTEPKQKEVSLWTTDMRELIWKLKLDWVFK